MANAAVAELLAKARQRWAPPEWAFFTEWEIPGAGRRMDALAVNLYASRGFLVHGLEVKTSRGDWLREKANSEKAEAAFRLCSFWWLVVPNTGIVKPEETPPGWGLMVGTKRGLRIIRRAEDRGSQVWTVEVFMGLLRRSCRSSTSTMELDGEYQRGFSDGHAQGVQAGAEGEASGEFRRLVDLQRKVNAFERASGLSITKGYKGGGEIGKAAKLLLDGGPERVLRDLKWLADSADRLESQAARMKADVAEERAKFVALRRRPVKAGEGGGVE